MTLTRAAGHVLIRGASVAIRTANALFSALLRLNDIRRSASYDQCNYRNDNDICQSHRPLLFLNPNRFFLGVLCFEHFFCF